MHSFAIKKNGEIQPLFWKIGEIQPLCARLMVTHFTHKPRASTHHPGFLPAHPTVGKPESTQDHRGPPHNSHSPPKCCPHTGENRGNPTPVYQTHGYTPHTQASSLHPPPTLPPSSPNRGEAGEHTGPPSPPPQQPLTTQRSPSHMESRGNPGVSSGGRSEQCWQVFRLPSPHNSSLTPY